MRGCWPYRRQNNCNMVINAINQCTHSCKAPCYARLQHEIYKAYGENMILKTLCVSETFFKKLTHFWKDRNLTESVSTFIHSIKVYLYILYCNIHSNIFFKTTIYMKYTNIIIYNYNKYSTFKDLKFACENSHQTSFSLRITVKWSMRAICKTSKGVSGS